ncbi:Two component regulator propeller [Dyadobacter soli]|uniref:histidine kinase n=2 Tax=Dyadobacter soli TaxID=659014 RepID=A0A1G7T327_9BACT|nr:Two component regulator propeller [Dyadobacter soli]
MLKALFCDSKGNLWVGGSGGLDRYNSETDDFTHIDHNLPNANPERNNQIYFISEDRNHRILVGTPYGLNSIEVTASRVKVSHVLHRIFEKGSSQSIISASETSSGDLWVGSFDGIVQVPRNGAAVTTFRYNSKDKAPLHNEFPTQYLDDQNVIWLGPNSGGIVQFDIATKTFRPVPEFRDPDGNIPLVTKILPDGTGKLWIANLSGLARFDPVSRKATWYRNQEGNLYSLADNSIQTMCLDRQGGIWMGTHFLGISNFYPGAPRFVPWPSQVGQVSEARYPDSWIGRSKKGQLWLIDQHMRMLQLFDNSGRRTASFDLKLKKSNGYFHFYLDGDETLWGAGTGMITSYNIKTRVQKDYPLVIEGKKGLESGRVTDILEDSRNRFWLVGPLGALSFNKKTGRFIKHTSVGYAHGIMEDSHQNIWVGGGDQVFLLKRSATFFEEVATDKRIGGGNFAAVQRMGQDGRGRIWAATRQGLQFFEEKSRQFRLDPKIQLSKIEDLQIDSDGYIWLATDAELTRYHPDKNTSQTYSYQDGLPYNGISRPASSVQVPNNNLYFTTNRGIFEFTPKQIKVRNDSSALVFTELKLSGREVKAGDDTGLLTKNLSQTTRLTLRYNQNIFSVDFALLSFPRSERAQYAYKLQGFDDKWIYSANPSTTYMNLPPGEYVLSVRAANGDGYWNPNPIKLNITILPPWWKTWYAYLFYVLLFAAAVYGITRFIWLRSSFRRETALNQVKLDFFTNVSHEIRTHLSLISGPLEKVYEQFKEGKNIENNLNYARNNSDRLMLLVNELLDFRKIQTGGVRLQVQQHDVTKIIKNVIAAFEHLAREKEIETLLVCPDTPVLLWLDIAQMQKVFYNLLSNAYKFTPEGGKVVVRIVEISSEVSITVQDNGAGISEEHLRQLFTYYYQADSEKPGYGIGLALSKSIVEQHHGYLNAESKLATGLSQGGTALTIRLLRENRHFSPDQIVVKSNDYVGGTVTDEIEVPGIESNAAEKQSNTILIIEDNEQLRAFIKDLFQGDFGILEAENGQRGLKLAEEHLPDIVLSDVMMPEMNGLDLSARLKSNMTTSHIPVVLLTARTQNEQIIEGLTAGADDYLVKPFDPRILQLKIKNLISLRDEQKKQYRKSLSAGQDASGSTLQGANELFIARLKASVIENISEPGFGVNELARHAGMSVSVLYRKIRSLTGMTVNDFMKTIRFGEAKKLLESGVYNVSEVASIIGYDSARHFSNEFKKVFGQNPSESKRQISR